MAGVTCIAHPSVQGLGGIRATAVIALSNGGTAFRMHDGKLLIVHNGTNALMSPDGPVDAAALLRISEAMPIPVGATFDAEGRLC